MLSLASELLDDLELSRLPADRLLLKAARLARLWGAPDVQRWLRYETLGYSGTEQLSLNYMGWTGRWIDREKKTGLWAPLAQLEAELRALEAELGTVDSRDLSGDYVVAALGRIEQRLDKTRGRISRLSGVHTKVLALLHEFVTTVYYELMFSQAAEGIFQSFQGAIDAVLADRAADTLQKFPSAYERLADGDTEAISQALGTCRRIITAFADSVYPPSDEPVDVDGTSYDVGSEKCKNRLAVYVAMRTQSESRRRRLRQTLGNIWERASAGVHDEVTPNEARALILSTYVYLGELCMLPVGVDATTITEVAHEEARGVGD